MIRFGPAHDTCDGKYEDDVPRTEWVLDIDVSMSAASSRDFSHLAILLDVTALYGFIRASLVGSCTSLIDLQQKYMYIFTILIGTRSLHV